MRSGILDAGHGSAKKRSPRLRKKKIPKDSNKTDAQVNKSISLETPQAESLPLKEGCGEVENEEPAPVLDTKVQEWVDNQASNSISEDVQLSEKKEAVCTEVIFI